jgi:hypothetical protein
MDKVKVEPVGVEPLEAGFNRLHNMAAGRAPGVNVFTHWEIDFAGNDYLIPARGDELPQDFFGPAMLVAIRTVKKIDAGFAAAVKHGRRGFFVGVAAKRHGAKA